MVKGGIGPQIGVVTGFAGCGEGSRDVIHRRGRIVVILLMARNARGGSQVVVVIDVAICARAWRDSMGGREREPSAVVIKRRIQPGASAVALVAGLREIRGSGNVVHNLHAYAWGRHAPEPYDWAVSFENRIRELLLAEDHTPLINYENQLGAEADLAVPTPDHYLPLLLVIGTRTPSERVAFPVEGVDGGSVSMLALQVG